MSRLLANRGWRVDVLFCGAVDDSATIAELSDRLAADGIIFRSLLDLPAPPSANIVHHGGHAATLRMGQRALEVVETLHKERRFDLIEFADWGALGLASIQAKRAGIALQDTRLAVKLHGTTQWQREGNSAARASPHELKMEFAERYAFEHADVQFTPSEYMADYVRDLGWKVSDDLVVTYPYPDPEPASTTSTTPTQIKEFAFFADVGGRIQSLSRDETVWHRHRRYLIARFFVDAELTKRERIDLWQCLRDFDYLAHDGIQQAVAREISEREKLSDWAEQTIVAANT